MVTLVYYFALAEVQKALLNRKNNYPCIICDECQIAVGEVVSLATAVFGCEGDERAMSAALKPQN